MRWVFPSPWPSMRLHESHFIYHRVFDIFKLRKMVLLAKSPYKAQRKIAHTKSESNLDGAGDGWARRRAKRNKLLAKWKLWVLNYDNWVILPATWGKAWIMKIYEFFALFFTHFTSTYQTLSFKTWPKLSRHFFLLSVRCQPESRFDLMSIKVLWP